MEKFVNFTAQKERFLEENGMNYIIGKHLKWWMFVIAKIVVGTFLGAFFVLAADIGIVYMPVIFFAGYFGSDYLVQMSNINDNEDMLGDIKTVFDCLRIQVKAGVYITDAVSEIIPLIRNKRLKRALIEMGNTIMLTNDIDESLRIFNRKFSNRHIDTLVIILRQALLSGQSAQSLDNAFDQMTDIEQALNLKLENSLERKVAIVQIMVLFGIILAAGFCSISEFAGMFGTIK